MAAAAFRWEAAAKASWASRLRLYFCARFSAVMPIWKSLKASHKPSWIIESTRLAWPMRRPVRALGST